MSLVPAFIQINRIKQFSVISENLDSKLIKPTLIMVQDLYLCDVLGKDLYAELISEVSASTPGSIPMDAVSSLNITLLDDYIEPYLINKVISELVIDITYKLRNKSIMTTSSDFGQVANLTDLSKVQGKYNNIAEGYRAKLQDYLCENAADYPLYCPKNTESTVGGFFLGNKRQDPRDFYYDNKYRENK